MIASGCDRAGLMMASGLSKVSDDTPENPCIGGLWTDAIFVAPIKPIRTASSVFLAIGGLTNALWSRGIQSKGDMRAVAVV